MNPALSNLVNLSETGVGHALIHPSFHTDPSFLSDDARESARLFDRQMLNHNDHPALDALEIPENGETAKVHFRVGGQQDETGKVQPSSIFMVKPYYEDLSDWQYGHYPLSGWAEMAWHGLLNAGDLHHLAMRVHTFPYQGSALLGVELEHGMHPVGWAYPGQPWNPETHYGRVEFPEELKDDASKLAAMDFLLNNQDRNRSNLLMSVSDQGQAHGLLAIDNGRSMQYMESHKNASFRNFDSPFSYIRGNAYSAILGSSLREPLKSISGWWKQAKPKVTGEFYRQLHGVRHYALATHMADSFDSRVKALDTLVEDFGEHGAEPYKAYLEEPFAAGGKAAHLYHRASVKMQKWEPEHDPMPLAIPRDAPPPMTACPTCGDDWEMGQESHRS